MTLSPRYSIYICFQTQFEAHNARAHVKYLKVSPDFFLLLRELMVSSLPVMVKNDKECDHCEIIYLFDDE